MTEAERITQEVADRRFNAGQVAMPRYRVELPGIPAAELLADSPQQAIDRYNDLCGITGVFQVQHHVTLIEDYPPVLPDEL